MICADGFAAGICYGDGGGPMAYVSDKKVVQLGASSFGRMGDCGSYGNSPAVFTSTLIGFAILVSIYVFYECCSILK